MTTFPFPSEALKGRTVNQRLDALARELSDNVIGVTYGSTDIGFYEHLEAELRDGLTEFLLGMELTSHDSYLEEGDHLKADADYQRSAGL